MFLAHPQEYADRGLEALKELRKALVDAQVDYEEAARRWLAKQ